MKKATRILSLILSLVMVVGLLSSFASAYSISDSGFTKIGSLPNDLVATQGMCTDGTYIYTFKMESGNNNKAYFYRTNISSGSTSLMKYTDDTSIYTFIEMGHGNDMACVVHNGTTYLYVATMYHKSHSTFQTHSIWKFQVSGNNLKKVAYYDVVQGTTNRNFTGLALFKQTDTTVTLLGANGQNVYAMDIGINQASGSVSCTKAFSINYKEAPTPTSAPTYTYQSSGGTVYYDVQGMTYDCGRLYYVLTASSNKTPRKHNYIFSYDVSSYPGNTSTRTAIASESIYVTSSTYSYFLEFESIDIHNGVMYFSANAGKSGYYENYDFAGKLKQAFATTPEYTVTFCNEAGATLQSLKVLEGSAAKFTGTTPTKAYDDNNHYTFKEWVTAEGTAADLSKITGDLKVYPGFTATAHSYTETITTAPSCSAEGLKTYTCSCSRSYTEAIATLEHTPVVVNGKEPTCTTPGYTGDTVCSVCSAPISAGTEIPVIPHNAVTIPGYAPTCSAEGLTDGSKCDACGEILVAPETIPATEHRTEVIPGKEPTCLSSGISEGLKCADCGIVVKAQQTLPRLGHSYIYSDNGDNHIGTCERCSKTTTASHSYDNGTCICGATLAPKAELDSTITIGHTLNLASDISINYAVLTSLLNSYDSYYLECEIPVFENNVQTGTRTEKIQPVLNGYYYYFTLEGLNAVSMNHEITAKLHMEKDGKAYVSNPDLYSVATYAYSQLNKEGSAESLKALCANLLRYGSVAQQFKNYCTNDLPDGKMTDAHKAYLSDMEGITFDTVNRVLDDLEEPAVTWAGKSLILDSKVTLKFIFNGGEYSGDPTDLSLKVTYTNTQGKTVTTTLKGAEVYPSGANRYCFDFDGLLAAELRSTVSVAVYDGETRVSPTLEYSASSYGTGKTGDLLTLCKALMAYSDMAKAYFA